MMDATIAVLLAVNAVVITISLVENFKYFDKFKDKQNEH